MSARSSIIGAATVGFVLVLLCLAMLLGGRVKPEDR